MKTKPAVFMWYWREPNGSLRELSPNPVLPETPGRLELLKAGRLVRVEVKHRGRGRPKTKRQEPATQRRILETFSLRMKAKTIVEKASLKLAAARRRVPDRYSKALDQIEGWAFVQGWEAALSKHAALLTLSRAVVHAPGKKPKPE